MADFPRWWSNETLVVVTGANQGIGLQLVREFARRGLTTVLTSRDEQRGKQAVELLKQEEGLQVEYHQLDVTDSQSVQRLASWLQARGGLDILVNNAAYMSTSGLLKDAKLTVETNYRGTRRVTEALLPLLKPAARIVNVSSKAGDLNLLKNQGWAAKMDDVATLSLDTIDAMVAGFLKAVEEGKVLSEGWSVFFSLAGVGSAAYCMSKLALNAYTRMLARDFAAQGEKHTSINCVCPGGTSTAMSGRNGHSVELGADTPLWASLAPGEALGSGNFYTARQNVGYRGMPLHLFGKLLNDEEVEALLQKRTDSLNPEPLSPKP